MLANDALQKATSFVRRLPLGERRTARIYSPGMRDDARPNERCVWLPVLGFEHAKSKLPSRFLRLILLLYRLSLMRVDVSYLACR
jgi:hypothetical protein